MQYVQGTQGNMMDERDIRLIMEALPDAALLIDADGHILGVNDSASGMLKYLAKAAMRLTVEDLLPERYRRKHPDLRKSFVATRKHRSMSRNTAHKRYFPLRIADGQEIITEISIARLKAKTRPDPLFLVVVLDRSREVELEQKLKARANLDQLTQLGSRACFMEQAEQEMTRSSRYHRPASLIFFDIDHFKKINDTYGHHIGDLLLQQVGRICRNIVRAVDTCGRLGGEEFAVLAPETSLEEATAIAERLRAAIMQPMTLAQTRICVSASFGVTEMRREDAGFEAVYNRADKALYCAKNEGRNRVRIG